MYEAVTLAQMGWQGILLSKKRLRGYKHSKAEEKFNEGTFCSPPPTKHSSFLGPASLIVRQNLYIMGEEDSINSLYITRNNDKA